MEGIAQNIVLNILLFQQRLVAFCALDTVSSPPIWKKEKGNWFRIQSCTFLPTALNSHYFYIWIYLCIAFLEQISENKNLARDELTSWVQSENEENHFEKDLQ